MPRSSSGRPTHGNESHHLSPVPGAVAVNHRAGTVVLARAATIPKPRRRGNRRYRVESRTLGRLHARGLPATRAKNAVVPELPHSHVTPTDRNGQTPEEPIAAISDARVDQALVESVQRGERNTFDLLVRKYQQKVARLISRYVHDSSEVLDVAQEVFLRAYRALPNFRGDSTFYTWLHRIAVNTAINHLDFQGRRLPVLGAYSGDLESEFDHRHYDTPEHLLLAKEIRETVIDAFEDLPMILREALTLCELEGMSYEEIAQLTHCPIGTVRSRIFRAREAISSRLKPLLD